MRTALYRHFDADGVLLYVGISLSAVQRLAQHEEDSAWFERIARVDIDWLPTRRAALAAEAIAISEEKPRHNKARPRLTDKLLETGEAFAIRHLASGRLDGWYVSRTAIVDAVEMVRFWRTEYPLDRFEIVAADREKANWIPDSRTLRSFNSREWSAAQ